MGCGGSKVDGLEAVTLCRGRSDLLADAIRHRYDLAAAHAAYFASLRSIGASLHRLLPDGSGGAHDPLLSSSSSPVLPLPTQRKGDPFPVPSPSPSPLPAVSTTSIQHSHSPSHSHSGSGSGSGSHIDFHSDDEDSNSGSDAGIDSPFHSSDSSPIHHYPNPAETLGPTFINNHYARSQPPPPSVSYEHRPQNPESVQFGSVEPSYYGYPYPTQNPTLNPYSYPYPYAPNYYGYGGMGMGGFFGPSSPPASGTPPPPAPVASVGPSSLSSSRDPPPPPSPPRTSTWDFLNPFESYGSYYPSYTPSRSSKEVREEEGIPDLEEEEHEVVKEAYVDQKFVHSTSAARTPEEYSSTMPSSSSKNDGVGGFGEDSRHRPRSVAALSSTEVEANVVEKNVAHEGPRSVAAPRRHQDVSEVVSVITAQFKIASESSLELSRMLEVGKYLYRQKNSMYEVPSRVMNVMTPSSSKNGDLLNFEDDMIMNPRGLSSTLQKLYMWEKKLYHEVKAEEKMRLLHDKNCKRLKRLDKRGAEAHKIDYTRTVIRKLSTKIRVAIQVVDSISKKINKLRDEELGPQINEIIQGLTRMWTVMLECQRTQCQAISEAKSLDSVSSGGRLSDTLMDALMQFELELLRWISNFSDWISAQKSYVKALNGWLILCLHYKPEVTPDGIPPYSPGRLGAPPVFVICNYWSQAMDRICEKEVVDAMQAFATNVRHLCEGHDVEQSQKMMENRDMERWLKAREREREAQTIHKEVDALRKKLVLVPGQNGQVAEHQDHGAEARSLQLGLKQIFEAMENFTASSVKAYEELHLRSEEERMARENSKVP